MAVVFAKLAADIHRNPKIRRAGRNAREVFLLVLAINADKGATGAIAADYADPWYLADTLLCSEDEAREGLERAIAVGLLERLPNGSIGIIGWDEDKWGRGYSHLTEAERKKLKRQKEKAEAEDRASDASEMSDRCPTTSDECPCPSDASEMSAQSEADTESEPETESENSYVPDSPTGEVATPKPRAKGTRPIPLHFAAAERLWGLQDRLRAEAMPRSRRLEPNSERLGRVIRLLESGLTEGDLEAVLRARADEVRRDPSQGQWFDGVSNWRPENVDRQLGRIGAPVGPRVATSQPQTALERQLERVARFEAEEAAQERTTPDQGLWPL